MNNTTAIIILIAITVAMLIVWYRRVGRLRCSYNGPTDSFAIFNNTLCKCKYPNQFARKLRRIDPDECLSLKDGELVECDEPPPSECESSLLFARGSDIGICRGRNVKPYMVDGRRFGITLNASGGVEPIIKCTGSISTIGSTRDARLWFKEPACVNSRIVHQPINLIQSSNIIYS